MDVYLSSQILKKSKEVNDHKSRDGDNLWKGELQCRRDMQERSRGLAVFYFLTWYIYFT